MRPSYGRIHIVLMCMYKYLNDQENNFLFYLKIINSKLDMTDIILLQD